MMHLVLWFEAEELKKVLLMIVFRPYYCLCPSLLVLLLSCFSGHRHILPVDRIVNKSSLPFKSVLCVWFQSVFQSVTPAGHITFKCFSTWVTFYLLLWKPTSKLSVTQCRLKFNMKSCLNTAQPHQNSCMYTITPNGVCKCLHMHSFVHSYKTWDSLLP